MTHRLPGVDPDLVERASKVRLLVLDVDGVITDGRMWYGEGGEMMKAIDTRDGHGIVMIRHNDIEFAVLSGRPQKLLRKRFEELGFEHIVERCLDKVATIRSLTDELGISLEQTAFVGDDVNDIGALELVGLAAVPADAHEDAKAVARYVCDKRGGRGAVREVCELLLKARGRWPAL